ncbi:formate/nitrite transporter family protein [Loigolactobacillus jiayinensis]|uniref:Formate/nitrite transporter family protein n=1 Tax=Loigolactobacillus jiayinensis TaxID=2486016 RepID=A0ABW1RKH7_9LACO|nr:formate/nitrite transporter family protein [Loigolactobacillus jiayinensis]
MNKADQVIDDFSVKAKTKTQLSFGRLMLLGILAGAFIAMGYLAFVRVAGTTPKAWGSFSTFLGACLFPIGLLAIVFLGGELVTGNMMVLTFGYLKKTVTLFDMAKNWILVLIANCLGGALIAFLFGHVVGLTEGDFAAKTIAIATAKLADSPTAMVVSGIGCNILVGMAIFLGAMSKDFFGKVVGVWFPIMIFVISGFQHVVANAFILTAAVLAGAPFTAGALLTNIVLVFVGNAIGASIGLAVPVYFANHTAAPVAATTVVTEPVSKSVNQVINR